ncbi:Hypothetical_protein [Hexamita inflata]|uniref:Hypothetical_protein n=1 Tax=Hexamita inflata TaxID=28002 RepID=A0AA86QJZ3_9EUKA|nr:Hypothetical protein HINF_LOCUS40720 [Hexamita inflata]
MYVRRTSATKTGIHLRRTICVSKEAMERLPLSNPEGSLTAAQHLEPGILPSATDWPHLRKWYFTNASSALALTAEPNRSHFIILILQFLGKQQGSVFEVMQYSYVFN